jgi:hypothetical protein
MAQQGATLQNYVRSHAASMTVGWVPLSCCQWAADAASVLCVFDGRRFFVSIFPLCQNNELVRCLEDLREKRELLNKTVSRWDAPRTRDGTAVCIVELGSDTFCETFLSCSCRLLQRS